MDSASWLRSFYPSVSVPSWEFGTVQSITWKAASAAGGFLCVRLCFAPDSTYKVLYGFLWSLFTFAANSDKPIFLFEILSKSEKRIWSLDVCVFAATLSSTAEALTWCCFFCFGTFQLWNNGSDTEVEELTVARNTQLCHHLKTQPFVSVSLPFNLPLMSIQMSSQKAF